ncbi:hypothetical protein [Prosthecobacter fusiformis]|nr:hypothetical protein [Prosthecobacter fusiformis]
MRDFLERNKDKYGLVLMTDVRDVVFQTDPFEIPLGGDVEFFEESSIVKIKDCSFNSGAIRERFGSEILQECQDQPIHCFGTVRGSIGGILSFLKMYEVYCMEAIQYATGTADQGILNVMINKFSSSFDFVTVPNLTGAVATLGWMKYKDIPINAVGGIINPINGKSIPIIHQYDRFPQLEDLVERQTSNKY